jgi:hypothetical protein
MLLKILPFALYTSPPSVFVCIVFEALTAVT